MYIVAGVVIILFLLLVFLSGKETVDAGVSTLFRPFYRISLYLYKWACIYRVPFFCNRQVEKDLEKLYPGENRQQKCTEYYVSKLAKSLLICLAGTFLGVIISAQAAEESILGENGVVERGSFEEGAKQLEVEGSFANGIHRFEIEVGAEVYDEEEIQALREKFRTELGTLILGGNASLQDICQKLELRENYEGYPFTVDWASGNLDVVSSDGALNDAIEESEEVQLRASISYGEWEWEENILVRVQPRSLSAEEQLHRNIEKMLTESERNSRTEHEWKLPGSWQGQPIVWKQNTDDFGPILWGGIMLVSFLIYMMADKDLHDDVEKRKLRMKREYPDVVHKLTLYLGAGMTIRRAFQRMAEEYEQSRMAGGEQCPIYEEILHTCRELKAGVSEAVAYEHLGKQTGLQEYIRLSTLLSQNLKKGNSTLLSRLQEEAGKASVERIQYSRRLAEEAVTKLLLPMVMMLLVVMLMIMIPAFSSMGT